jgi:glutamate--cysteine ligase
MRPRRLRRVRRREVNREKSRMSAPPSGGGTPIEDRRQLVEYFAAGNKPRAAWRMGTEHEKFGFDTATLKPLPYDGERGVRAMLEGLRRFGWEAVTEGNNIIALQRGKASITLEPGGQFELSGAPLETLHETAEENAQHIREVKAVAGEIGAGYIGLGFAPEWTREDIHWMPKGRYKIMRDYMPKKGKLGLDMMLRTCTVQTNLDFESEADMVKKFRVSLALQPLATALFANSPFVEGKDSGFKSYRSHIWTDTDPDRCGMLPFVFEEGFGFERYADYMLDVPMYFVYRDGKYIDASGQSFKDFMKGKLPARPGELPTINDWADHVTTAFPEVRLKRYLEMRGADSGPIPALNALPAFWVGLLYDQSALDAAWDVVKDWTVEDHDYLRSHTPRNGLATRFQGRPLSDLAREVVEIAHTGLRARRRLDAHGNDETIYLAPLDRAVASGLAPADELLAKWKGEWGRSFAPLFRDYAY